MVSPDRIERHTRPRPRMCAGVLLQHPTATKNDSVLVDRYSLSGKFLDSFARFVEVAATHTFENCLVLGELDICVLHDLHAVSPRIPELHSSPGQELDAGFRVAV